MRFITLLLAALAALPANAQSDAEAAVLPRIIDTLCINMVEALNGCETAVLLTSDSDPDAADLMILSDRRASDAQSILSVTRNIAFNGAMFGQSPRLEAGDNGTLYVHEEQIGIGRSPWTNTLTIIHRDDGFLVAGQSYSTYDRIAGGTYSCDVNLLTGGWIIAADRINTESGETIYDVSDTGTAMSARPVLADWSWSRGLPAPCEVPLTDWFNAEPQ